MKGEWGRLLAPYSRQPLSNFIPTKELPTEELWCYFCCCCWLIQRHNQFGKYKIWQYLSLNLFKCYHWDLFFHCCFYSMCKPFISMHVTCHKYSFSYWDGSYWAGNHVHVDRMDSFLGGHFWEALHRAACMPWFMAHLLQMFSCRPQPSQGVETGMSLPRYHHLRAGCLTV